MHTTVTETELQKWYDFFNKDKHDIMIFMFWSGLLIG